ncbi:MULTISPECIES: shikimate dehydrogenase [unclassified Oceanobacter]|jgi:shikimate dehydrogenase|uniref:shikimate dehydrogenase n=1 Tax=unclassified Oceanobacter TaxID=2620260 RepID=UPI0027353EFA|nr:MULTISPECIES: shikimate dehydrogenase [unclassified Oceanobacter]MDP2546908.1 shikimate dehydrogenase [Oceanobacter sp. 4_MG-2023]MDP2607732.1 shikimate dehydrogenase [Oceanobacter sp. 1_MG-2023]MDP2611084.1 shikimate dehydrogenase [Oceanobacter sp. 2_MG-2023]
MTDRYAVVGNPIGHSKSPLIHTEFAAQTGEDILYTALLFPRDGFERDARLFFEHGGGCGMNITVPFKEEAYQLADAYTDRARRAGAVNTLKKQPDGSLLGDNTDGAGLVLDLKRHQVPLAGQRILLLGAGGAVKGVLQPLLEEHPAELVIANRTVSKAEQLAADFSDLGNICASGFAGLSGPFDLIINGTSASLGGDLPPLADELVAHHTITYDMMYGDQATVFNAWAGALGAAQTIDGLGMLVGQAAEAFYVWRGKRPDVAPVLSMLRNDRRR